MNTREKGTEYEHIAANYLQNHGVIISECNYRSRQGEIDIIGKDGEYTVFFEVKYRKNGANGQPAEAVNYRKQRKICKVADHYRMIHQIGEFSPVRYDIVAICGTEITWYQNAFAHIYT
ncbi:MAG: YraN family protein [Lachnospiraceae bacterium]|jgi:putative endonuclease|nr:YraN family protein [Lachnospiraceae bacterium]HBV81486.1 YraN family protein [Lachnospiraceae bacterium]